MSISFYEEQFKAAIMNALVVGEEAQLYKLLQQLVEDHKEDYKLINYAYLNVKKELIG